MLAICHGSINDYFPSSLIRSHFLLHHSFTVPFKHHKALPYVIFGEGREMSVAMAAPGNPSGWSRLQCAGE